MITGVLGRLELALGNLEAAGGYLRELPARFLAGGVNDPTAPLWADAIETLIALGELEQARAYLEPYEANAQRLGSALARAGAARCRGLVLAADGDLAAGMAAFEASLADTASFPLECGRTLLCLGTVRQAGAAEAGSARGAGAGARDLRREMRSRSASGASGAARDQMESRAGAADLAPSRA